jgi:hypothetical protein
MAKWIEFLESSVNIGRKTKIFLVRNKEHGSYIGEVKWYGPWRQYSFFPSPNCVFERQCLMDIAHFINQLMVERKAKKG